jgi:hypothetical protein
MSTNKNRRGAPGGYESEHHGHPRIANQQQGGQEDGTKDREHPGGFYLYGVSDYVD